MREDPASGANTRIWDFVHQRANAHLRPGTGWYSTPFRGSLFGKTDSASVARLLGRRTVDALWLGANPGVRGSLQNILDSRSGKGDLPSFRCQIDSGFFGSWRWTDGTAAPDWNPIDEPKGGWRIYRALLHEVSQPDQIAMANLIPWGSQDATTFVRELDAREPALLRRLLEFADELNVYIVEILRPKLLIVPLSLGRNRALNAARSTGVSLMQAREVVPRVVSLDEGPFKFFTGYCERGRVTVPTVFLRHPASLRLSVESRSRLVRQVGRVVGRFIHSWA